MPASDTPPPVVAVWDATANCYVQASAPVCVAAGRSAGSLCGGKVFRRLGGAELCAEHYDRAMYDRRAVFQQEDEDYGWRYETQRQQWDPDAAEVVYYLLRESDGLIKIGTSARFRMRLAELRAEHGLLRVLLTHRGDRATETGMHGRFKRLRVHGEWFRPEGSLAAWILDLRNRQEEITPSRTLRETVALSEVAALLKDARRTQRRLAQDRCAA